jgi:hypothetical protein
MPTFTRGTEQATDKRLKRLNAMRQRRSERMAAPRIRARWPDIKRALDEGHSLQMVREGLEVDGIQISLSTLRTYVSRLRQKELPTVSTD